MTTYQGVMEHSSSVITDHWVIANSPLPMAITEGPVHIVRCANAAFCGYQGKPIDEIIGFPIADSLPRAGIANVVALFDRVYRGGISGSVNNRQYSQTDQGYVHTSYLAWAVPVPVGYPESLVIQVTDVTKQILANERVEHDTIEMLELNSEMRQVNEQLVISGLLQHTLADRNEAIAEALQYSILWRQPERLFGSLRVAAFYEPAGDEALVGGDLFDAFVLPNKSIVLTVGDVTGKGLKAVTRTSEIVFAVRALAQTYVEPAEIITRLNRFIYDFHHDDDDAESALVVLSIIVVDPVTGKAYAASAGAEPPFVLRASGTVEEVIVRGLILGVNRNAEFKSTEIILDEGDTLIMTTDGITETRSGREFFGPQRMLAAAQKPDGPKNLQDTGKSILDAARTFGGGRFSDDVCVLVARRDRIDKAS